MFKTFSLFACIPKKKDYHAPLIGKVDKEIFLIIYLYFRP